MKAICETIAKISGYKRQIVILDNCCLPSNQKDENKFSTVMGQLVKNQLTDEELLILRKK